MGFETLTGKTQEQIIEVLNQDLPDTAYNQVPGGANLTDIDPMYRNEKLTECFGLYGFGWGLDRPEHPDFQEFETRQNNKGEDYSLWCIGYDYAIFWYRAYDDTDELIRYEIETSGYAENSNRGWAFSGAKTSTIGEATKYLLWQMRVYKGEYHAKPQSEKAPNEIVLTFGKNKGKSLATILNEDRGYIEWLAKDAKQDWLKAAASKLLEEPKATEEQKEKIKTAIKDIGLVDIDKALKDAHFANLANLTEQQAKDAIERLEKAVEEKKEEKPKPFDPNAVTKMTFQNDWMAMLNTAIEHLENVTDIEKAKAGIKERFEGKATVSEGWEYLRDEYTEQELDDDEVF